MTSRGFSWSSIFAGALVAVGAGWTGELLAGWLSLSAVEPGAGSTAGLVLRAVLVCAGALAGGWIAGRAAQDRTRAALHGVAVWGLTAGFGALTFAILGGNVALITGVTAASMRGAFGWAFVGLVAALPLAAAGGAAGAERVRAPRRRVVRPPREPEARGRAREPVPHLEERTHRVVVETTDGGHRDDVYREGVSYPPEPRKPPVH